MTKFVLLGSRRFAPYEISFVPIEMRDILDEEERYQISIKRSQPAMDKADVIIVYAPDGIGEHTQRDIDYAREKNKAIFQLVPLQEVELKKKLPISVGWDFPGGSSLSTGRPLKTKKEKNNG